MSLGEHRPSVLVVDDNADAARTFAVMVEHLGYPATHLTDPRNALDNIEKLKPAVVFLDIGMPCIDGWTQAALIRAKYPADGIRLVAVTGYSSEDDRVRSRQVGFDAHVAKPISVAHVESILETMLTRPSRL